MEIFLFLKYSQIISSVFTKNANGNSAGTFLGVHTIHMVLRKILIIYINIYIYIYIYIILKNLCPDVKLSKMFQTKRNQIVLVPFPVP